MKSIFSYILIALSFFSISETRLIGQTPSLEWAKQFGGQNGGNTGNDIVHSPQGDLYCIGHFTGTVDFDPGPGVDTLNAITSSDLYIAKLNTTGDLLWVKQLGVASSDVGIGVATDNSGSVYVCGSFINTVDFDPGPNNYLLNSPGSTNGYLLKLDSNGNFCWAQYYPASFSYALDVAVDPMGNVLLSGHFGGSADFDRGPGINILDTGSSSNSDAFVLKLDSAGVFIWARRFSGPGHQEPLAITTDPNGNVLTSGRFSQTVDFDPGPGTDIQGFPNNGGFISKLTSSGQYVWANTFRKSSSWVIESSMDSCVYSVFYVADSTDFDPDSIGTYILSNSGGYSGTLAYCKFNPDGSLAFAKQFGDGIGTETAYGLAMDQTRNGYVTGIFYNTTDFDPGPGVFQLMNGNKTEVFVCSFDTAGDFRWAGKMGNPGQNDQGWGVTVDTSGGVYSTGYFYGTADFDPDTSAYNLTVNGVGSDVFVQKLTQCTSTFNQINTSGCDSIFVNGTPYYSTGVYTQVLTNNAGCDSVLTLDLQIAQSTTDSILLSGCDSLMVNGITYTSSGLFSQVLTNNVGCDSILNLDLQISQSSYDTLIAFGCDSLSVNGITYSETGVYSQLLTNSAGCDSIIEIDLMIDSLQAQIIQVGDSLISTNSGADSYQWYDCNIGFPIQGETSLVFNPISSGTYSVIVMEGMCIDTSSCIMINIVNIENLLFHGYSFFPNPAKERLSVTIPNEGREANLSIISIGGQILKRYPKLYDDQINIDLLNFPPGMYFLEIVIDEGVYRHKFLRVKD